MLDTLRYSKRLQSVGVGREQADAQAEALRDEIVESVATKAQLDSVKTQLENVEQRLDAKIDTATAALSTGIKHVEQRLSTEIRSLRWMIGLVVGLVGAVLVKLLTM